MSSPEPEAEEAGIIFDEDEDLPFIDIRERIDIDEVLQTEPLFSQFSNDQIYIMLQELTHHKAKDFMQIFGIAKENQYVKTPLPQYDTYSVPVLAAGRKNAGEEVVHENGVDTFPRVWNQQMIRALEAPNYRLQQSEKEKVWFHLEHIAPQTTEDSFTVSKAASTTTLVGLQSDVQEMTMLRRNDPEMEHRVSGVRYMIPKITNASYLHEKVEHAHDDVEMVATKPSFSDALNRLPSPAAVHDIKTVLAMHGFVYDMLDEKQMANLQEELNKPDVDDQKNTQGDLEAPHTVRPATDFLMSISWDEALQNLDHEKAIQNMERYAEYYESYIRNQSPQSRPIDVPQNLHDMAIAIAEGQYRLEDVIASISYERNSIMMDRMRNVITAYQEIDTSKKEKVLQQYARLYERYSDPVAQHFLQMYQDMAKVQQGEDRSEYDGNPADESVPLQEDAPAEVERQPLTTDWFNPMPEDTTAVIGNEEEGNTTQTSNPFNLQAYSEAVQEVIQPVLADLLALRAKAGIPFDVAGFLSYIVPKVHVISTRDVLNKLQQSYADDTQVTQMIDNLMNDMLLFDAKKRAQLISNVQPPSLRDAISKEVTKHSEKIQKAQQDVLAKAFVWWTLQAQQLALDRKLTRQVVISQECMSLWSEWGVPINQDEKGVLRYLLCNLEGTELSYITFGNLDKKIQTEMKDISWKPTIDKLKKQYETFGEDIQRVENKVIDVLTQLQVASKKALDNRGYSKEFARAILLLPHLETSQARRGKGKYANGCCLQDLNRTFVANTDWNIAGAKDDNGKILQNLYKLKKKLGDERVTNKHRSPLLMFGTMQEPPQPVATQEMDGTSEVSLPKYHQVHDIIAQWQETASYNVLIPVELCNMYLKDNVQEMQRETERIIQLVRDRAHVGGKLDMPSWDFSLENGINLLQQIGYNLKPWLHKEHPILLTQSLRILRDTRVIFHEWIAHIRERRESGKLQAFLLQVCARALCLPASPTDRILLVNGLSDEKTTAMMKEKIALWNTFMKTHTMPSVQKQQEYINLKREESKKENMAQLETLDIDTRRLVQATRRLGLPAEVTDALRSITGKTAEEEGEAEFLYVGEDQD